MPSPSTYIIELNEFNLDLMRQAAQQLDLPHLKRILNFRHGTTVADQEKEHQGLDPWVQWVSIHAEVPSQQHGVIRLGDVNKLRHEQVWERLARAGITTGVWGAMNASRKDAATNQFFFADPWTYSEAPYPAKLQAFLSLPIYYAKNYMALSPGKLAKAALQTAGALLKTVPLSTLFADAAFLVKNIIGTRPDSCFLFAAFELLSARIFSIYRRQHQPQANFIFLNSIAHFQHHQWKQPGHIDRRTAFLFRSVDRILGVVLPPPESNDTVVVLNGLTQRNVVDEALYCYRQIDPAAFLHAVNIRHTKVEQCMTNDGHVFFDSPEDCQSAAALLRDATVNGKPAFYVETEAENPTKLFYQVSFWDDADDQSLLHIGGRTLPFFSQFMVHAKRTGAHSPEGDYLASGAELPPRLENSRIFSYIWPVTP